MQRRHSQRRRKIARPSTVHSYVRALAATPDGEIVDLDGYAAVGMANQQLVPLTTANTIPMPFGGETLLLPERPPVVYNLARHCFQTLQHNPCRPREPVYAVAAFNSPGYVLRYHTAYHDNLKAACLPLFCYGAVGWLRGQFRTAVLLVDAEPRQDLRQMPAADIQAGIKALRSHLPHNRLCRHLEHCALQYGCPAAKNFFLGRYEAPLPTARSCNAQCWGCLSHQTRTDIPVSQNRIAFTPSPSEITEVALTHIQRVSEAVVSFGQGCEGDPLLAADVIRPAIELIRRHTIQGTINMNTNGSRPAVLKQLLQAGLDSVRFSLNSLRPGPCEAYFNSRDYRFEDVMESIALTLAEGRQVAINYLCMPGFTDTPEELEALQQFLKQHPVHMIQWRNLNFDPQRYGQRMQPLVKPESPLGMDVVIDTLRRNFPALRHGYFNPSKSSFRNYEL